MATKTIGRGSKCYEVRLTAGGFVNVLADSYGKQGTTHNFFSDSTEHEGGEIIASFEQNEVVYVGAVEAA